MNLNVQVKVFQIFVLHLKFQDKHSTNGRGIQCIWFTGLKNQSRRSHNIKNIKVTKELEKIILELRLYNRFGPMRIRFRLKRKYGISLGTKTIYNLLKRHNLNVLSVKIKRKYKRFEMIYPNKFVQMDIKEPFYLKGSQDKNYFIHVIDDCSRKIVSKWCSIRNSEKALL